MLFNRKETQTAQFFVELTKLLAVHTPQHVLFLLLSMAAERCWPHERSAIARRQPNKFH
jgi:hypothetical protein